MLPAPPRRWKRKARSPIPGRWAQWRYKAVEPLGQCRERPVDHRPVLQEGARSLPQGAGDLPRADHQTAPGSTAAARAGRPRWWPRRSTATSSRTCTIEDKDKTLEFKTGDPVPMFKYLPGRRLHHQRLLDLHAAPTPRTGTRWPAATRATPPAWGSSPSGPGAGRSTAASSTTAPRSTRRRAVQPQAADHRLERARRRSGRATCPTAPGHP